MHLPRSLVLLILLPFTAFSVWVLSQVGYLGLFTANLHPAGLQVLADLVIACTLGIVWIWRDARAQGRNPIPFVLLTLGLGSIGLLLYLLMRPAPTAAR